MVEIYITDFFPFSLTCSQENGYLQSLSNRIGFRNRSHVGLNVRWIKFNIRIAFLLLKFLNVGICAGNDMLTNENRWVNLLLEPKFTIECELIK